MKNFSFIEIKKIIDRSKSILAAAHQGPDADTIASLAAATNLRLVLDAKAQLTRH